MCGSARTDNPLRRCRWYGAVRRNAKWDNLFAVVRRNGSTSSLLCTHGEMGQPPRCCVRTPRCKPLCRAKWDNLVVAVYVRRNQSLKLFAVRIGTSSSLLCTAKRAAQDRREDFNDSGSFSILDRFQFLWKICSNSFGQIATKSWGVGGSPPPPPLFVQPWTNRGFVTVLYRYYLIHIL